MNELEQLREERDGYLEHAQYCRRIASNPESYFQSTNKRRRPKSGELEKIQADHLQEAERMDNQASQLGPRIEQLEAEEAFDRAREKELEELFISMGRALVRIFVPTTHFTERSVGWQWRRDIYLCLFFLLLILYVIALFAGTLSNVIYSSVALTLLYLEIFYLIPWSIKYKKSWGLILSIVLTLGTICLFIIGISLLTGT